MTWVDWMMRTQPDLTFAVVAIMPDDVERKIRFDFPENMIGFHNLYLHEFKGRKHHRADTDVLATRQALSQCQSAASPPRARDA